MSRLHLLSQTSIKLYLNTVREFIEISKQIFLLNDTDFRTKEANMIV
jgi:hypothetical protein